MRLELICKSNAAIYVSIVAVLSFITAAGYRLDDAEFSFVDLVGSAVLPILTSLPIFGILCKEVVINGDRIRVSYMFGAISKVRDLEGLFCEITKSGDEFGAGVNDNILIDNVRIYGFGTRNCARLEAMLTWSPENGTDNKER